MLLFSGIVPMLREKHISDKATSLPSTLIALGNWLVKSAKVLSNKLAEAAEFKCMV